MNHQHQMTLSLYKSNMQYLLDQWRQLIQGYIFPSQMAGSLTHVTSAVWNPPVL